MNDELTTPLPSEDSIKEAGTCVKRDEIKLPSSRMTSFNVALTQLRNARKNLLMVGLPPQCEDSLNHQITEVLHQCNAIHERCTEVAGRSKAADPNELEDDPRTPEEKAADGSFLKET